MQIWYAHMLTTVFMMTEPGGLSTGAYGLVTAAGSAATGRAAAPAPNDNAVVATDANLPYTQRGWVRPRASRVLPSPRSAP